MKLALVLGKAQGTSIVQRLKGIKDNLNIDVFENIPEFIDNSLKRNSVYDRILVLSTKLDNTTLKDLYNYWGSVSKETTVVLLCKSGVDETKAQLFLDTFKTPVASAMLVNSTTVQIIAEAVLRPTSELTADYGIKDFLAVEVDEDAFEDESTKKKEEPKPVAKKDNKKDKKDKSKTRDKNEKRSLFTSLFGGGKKKEKENKDNEQTLAQEPINPNTEINENNNIVNEEYSNDFSENYELNESMNNNYQDDTYANVDDSYSENYDTSFEPEQNNEIYNDSHYEPQDCYEESKPIQQPKSNLITGSQSFLVNEEFEGTFEDVPQGKNDFEPEPYNVDEDFSNDGMTDDYDSEDVHYSIEETSTTDENFEDLGLANDEETYRQTAEAPKVVTKTVVREVIRNINTGTNLSALDGVYSGRLKKILIVTGDRGTGVTSTAYNIARTLAKKTDVLYFDCDIENHGLLSYLDYGTFKNYENTHMNGIKLCKGSQAFDRCVISWDSNLYLLTSDYTCDATDEELRQTSEIVAERATDFGVVVVDCPVDKLHLITDLILTGLSVICVEGTKRGFMNMLCQFERQTLPLRFKRNLVAKGSMFVTKCNKNLDLNKLVSYIKAIYEPDEVNWLANKPIAFDGKLDEKLLNNILEG